MAPSRCSTTSRTTTATRNQTTSRNGGTPGDEASESSERIGWAEHVDDVGGSDEQARQRERPAEHVGHEAAVASPTEMDVADRESGGATGD